MTLRGKLVDIALEWQESFGVAPSITSAISEYDAAMLIGMSQNEYSEYMKDKTAVSKGADFVYWFIGRVERGSFTLTLSQNRA